MLVTPSNCRVIWSAVGETNLGCATLGIWQQHGSNLWGSHVGTCLRRHLFGRIERLITVSLCRFGVPAWIVPPRSQCCCSLWRQLHAFRLQKLQHWRQPDCVYWASFTSELAALGTFYKGPMHSRPIPLTIGHLPQPIRGTTNLSFSSRRCTWCPHLRMRSRDAMNITFTYIYILYCRLFHWSLS